MSRRRARGPAGDRREVDVLGASREVLRHHAVDHGRRCPSSRPVVMCCEHGSTTLVACSRCHEQVYLMLAPDTCCSHAEEVRQRQRPSGLWTEVTL